MTQKRNAIKAVGPASARAPQAATPPRRVAWRAAVSKDGGGAVRGSCFETRARSFETLAALLFR